MALAGALQGFGILMLILYSGSLAEASKKLAVPFPPAQPTSENLAAICHQGQGRPRYPDSIFPRSGNSNLRRRGKAINRLEQWFTSCCLEGGEDPNATILCCTRQAWKQALSKFCIEEISIMTATYECCKKQGDERWACFDSDLPNPDYSATPDYTAPTIPEEPGFTFGENSC
ncbi:extracellular matrix protein 1 [Nerophis lumbriciformis]|uniref:extracellular matrix protein 1 n=1 Tax=Nerophis lumbriciformis TaxID=546530 RepID=UPI002AE0AE02|nr:extracellular matrix protein 1-like [Nerophis lumbriciformis]